MLYHGFFILLHSDRGNSFQDVLKKCYAYLVLENVGSWQ